ncbi:hypothetical protein GH714_016930 [Hevea brasiliensis]|uniref:NB-ARC domain-containing protein n=1 Tax=Hevea brasiliensis TaxID=3981 RepID=A0A6A6N8C3_HEVBR|nr:hypothetical protein GH714_016930 [Hevea brasiliensis]
MAAEVVAGAFLSSMFQFLFERMDSPEIAAFFKGHKLDLSQVKKLKVAMITVTGLLDHAEEKQIVVPAVKKWLDELKDAAYEADDLLDEIAYEALRSELEAGSTTKKLYRLFSSHNPFEMAVNAKLGKILELLEYLTRQMNALGLTLREGIGDKPSSHKTPTTSLPDDESIGIGGMGKTTLAQLVYNDKQVDRHFNLKAWVYVSEEFNVFKITTEIRSKVSSEDCKANNLNCCAAVKKWLDELKDAAYEADDLLDEIAYEALRSELEAGSTTKKLYRLFSSHNPFEMAVNAKLGKILELLEYLTRQMNALGLTLREGIGDKPSSHKTPTTSLPDDESIGIGGMGKTTLAQLVYNDKQVDRHFNLKAWVYVSEEFNVFKITTEIRSKVSSEDCKANNLSELQQELKQKLEGKKYLLVLDDVWSDKYAEWESLLKPLKAGAQGSKIVVTTRIESIASALENNQMLIDLIHPLEKLSDDDCWSMLATMHFMMKFPIHHLKLLCFQRVMILQRGFDSFRMAEGFIMEAKEGDDNECG